MNRIALIIAASVLALGVAGCSAVKRATGQLDDSVLPGQRENVLPPDQQTARDPNVMGGQSAPKDLASQCAPNEPNCIGSPQADDQAVYQDPIVADEPPTDPIVTNPPPKKVATKKPVKKKKPIVKKPVAPATPPAMTDDEAPALPDSSGEPPKL